MTDAQGALPGQGVQSALVARSISLSFGGLSVLRALSVEAKQGEKVTVIGPNGAGKTTLFNVISGLLKPQDGQVLMNGRDITRLSAHKRARIGLGRGFQITNLFPDLDLWETALLAMIRRAGRDYECYRAFNVDATMAEAVRETLNDWGFPTHRGTRVRELSYGDQRRLDICLALLMKPTVLLLDEPTAGLSARESVDIVETIRRLPRTLTCLIVTHDLRFGFEIADRVVGLHQGQIVIEGTPQEVQADQLLRTMYF